MPTPWGGRTVRQVGRADWYRSRWDGLICASSMVLPRHQCAARSRGSRGGCSAWASPRRSRPTWRTGCGMAYWRSRGRMASGRAGRLCELLMMIIGSARTGNWGSLARRSRLHAEFRCGASAGGAGIHSRAAAGRVPSVRDPRPAVCRAAACPAATRISSRGQRHAAGGRDLRTPGCHSKGPVGCLTGRPAAERPRHSAGGRAASRPGSAGPQATGPHGATALRVGPTRDGRLGRSAHRT